MVSRYRRVSEIRDILDEKVGIRVLQDNRMFNEDKSVSKEFISKYVRPELILRGVGLGTDRKVKPVGVKGVEENMFHKNKLQKYKKNIYIINIIK